MSSVQFTTNQFCENQGLGGLEKYPVMKCDATGLDGMVFWFQLSVEERSRRLSDPQPASGSSSSSINNIIDSLLQLLQSLNHASVVQFFTYPGMLKHVDGLK